VKERRQILGGAVLALSALPLWAEVDFAHEVVPILKAHCVECHGGAKSKGGLSMNTRGLLLEAEVVEVGNPGESTLIELITSSDPKERMPSSKKGEKPKPPLKKEEIETLKKWIAEGLGWEDGFTFAEERYNPPLKPRRPVIPSGKKGENAIDRVVRAYFEKNKAKPPKGVTDEAYARRLYLDLIGIPPTPEELKAFVESKDRQKRSKLVDDVLARDQQFSEHWLTFWNDLLRNAYAGTGYIDGGRRQITGWLYKSLLENKPYDQFVRELIAPTGESDGFIRGIKWRGNVNASQTREVQFSQNISQVFLGINMKCASCHDSFINDWKLKDAYGLAAIFSEKPLELFRCDKPTGEMTEPKWIFPELGTIDASKPQKERLQQLAGLMTHPENGRMQRTIVNRLWKQLMGRGIVHPVDAMGTAPWSEDLLDYLAVYLVEQKYDLKKVISLIAKSKAYHLKSEIAKEGADDYVFRGPVMKRMSAEQFLDSIRSTIGVWTKPANRALKGGGAQGGQLAAAMKAHGIKDWGDRPVRTVFTELDSLQAALGRPNREQVVSSRPELLTTLEAITLSNGPRLAAILKSGAGKLAGDSSPDATIERLYISALARKPSRDERSVARGLMGSPVTTEGVEDLLWTIFMLPEFQFVN
jgi:hypothetical protein